MTRVKLLNRRRLTRSPTAVANCSLPVTAVHADLLTYIHARNGFRGITNARPSPSVPTFTVSGNDTMSLTYASLRSQYQWHQSDLLPDSHSMRWIMACSGANVRLLPAFQHALAWPRETAEEKCFQPESESLFKREITGELRLTRAGSRSVDACPSGKVEGMCKLLPRTMQDFALNMSGAFPAVVRVRTKCFRKHGKGRSRWVLAAPFSGP